MRVLVAICVVEVVLCSLSVLPLVGQPVSPGELKRHVTIYRDKFGVPHILGDTEQATFFGYGYAQAQDHLEGIVLQYRDAQGRLSEIRGDQALGDGKLTFNASEYRWGGDYFQRQMRTWQCVADNKDKIDPIVYQILDAFAQGVNYYIHEHRSEIPAWIEDVSAIDIEALERSNYMRFYSVDPALLKLEGTSRTFDSFGSNQVAIAPAKSATQRIIHLEHLHMPWSNRFQNYEAHLITPGKLDVAGISWFGSPFFLVGFNEKITWSVTWNQPNIADVYEERLNPANSKQYLYEGIWRDMRVESAALRVKQPDGSIKTLSRALYYTHHGPVVGFDDEHHRAFSIKVPNFDGVNYSTGLYALMKANGIASFKAALAKQLIPRWNFLCTTASTIYWVHNALVAQRDTRFDWTKPVPGWLKDTEWGPYLPFSANPQLENPASGFLQNCNNPPWLATRNSGVDPLAPTPYYLEHPLKAKTVLFDQILKAVGRRTGEELLNPRGERVFSLITASNRKFSLEDMIDLGFDTYVLASDVIVPLLDEASRDPERRTDMKAQRAVALLRTWNRQSTKDSYAFTYLFYWAKAYQKLYSMEAFGRFVDNARQRIDIRSSKEEQQAWRALDMAVAYMEHTYGRLPVRWGDVNKVARNGVFPVGGADLFDVLHPDTGSEQGNGQIYCDGSWGHMMIVMEGAPKQIWSLLPFGESEHVNSVHYNDQAILHSQRKVKPFWSTPADILANTESVWGDSNRMRQAGLLRQ